MDIPRLRYSPHAAARMRTYRISEDEVEAVVWYPARRIVSRWAVEHYGYADDGRKIKVVTNRSETYVYTITDEDRRFTNRREKERRRRERRRT